LGEQCPIEGPDEPLENRPSVTRTQGFPQDFRLQVAGRREHLLHAWCAARPLVAHPHDSAGLHAAQDAGHRGVLALLTPAPGRRMSRLRHPPRPFPPIRRRR
jgi:hypothetical protein